MGHAGRPARANTAGDQRCPRCSRGNRDGEGACRPSLGRAGRASPPVRDERGQGPGSHRRDGGGSGRGGGCKQGDGAFRSSTAPRPRARPGSGPRTLIRQRCYPPPAATEIVEPTEPYHLTHDTGLRLVRLGVPRVVLPSCVDNAVDNEGSAMTPSRRGICLTPWIAELLGLPVPLGQAPPGLSPWKPGLTWGFVARR